MTTATEEQVKPDFVLIAERWNIQKDLDTKLLFMIKAGELLATPYNNRIYSYACKQYRKAVYVVESFDRRHPHIYAKAYAPVVE